jgi:hypothetical protein
MFRRQPDVSEEHTPSSKESKRNPNNKPAETYDKLRSLGLLFDCEDGGDIFLRNVGIQNTVFLSLNAVKTSYSAKHKLLCIVTWCDYRRGLNR